VMFAADGQILINQATVTAAGGFPYVISQPGSYKLSGNLVVPANTDGIHLLASNVTLDLNGFSITAPVAQTVFPTAGIRDPNGATAITIRNGTIRGFLYPISPVGGSYWALAELILTWGLPESFSGMNLGPYSRIEHIIAPDSNVGVMCPSIVTFSTLSLIFYSTPGSTGCTFTGNSTASPTF